jgi:hypothetical protein
MPARPDRPNGPPKDPGRPTPREAIAKVRAEAAPRVAKAVEAAGPTVEKAAVRAGKLFGTLRDRARDTAKQFGEGYRGSDEDEGPSSAASDTGQQPADQPRRRPRPGPGPG